jgi:AraC-like DNA-binding protein
LILPNGLQAALIDYTIKQDFLIKREKTREEFYTLRFDEVTIKDSLTVSIDDETLSDHQHVRAAVMLTSSLFDFTYFGTKNGSIKGINVLITREWMATYLGIKSQDEVLQQYLSLKTASFNLEPLDAGYRELMYEVLAEIPEERSPLNIIMVQNRIMMLVERFFTRLYAKMKDIKELVSIANDEMQRMMDAEALLIRDFSVPAPTIPELARHAAMSETKFKNQFKKIYDSGPYEYFQKNRMQRARYLLLSRKFSVKETGQQLGFNNLSNFTIAFKKEFGLLPSEV